MKSGGISTSNSAQQVLRWTTLLAPLFIGGYTYLASKGIFATPVGYSVTHNLSDLFSLLWVVSGVLLFIFFSPKLWNAAIRIAMFHILGGFFLAMYIGFSFPLAVLWLALVLATYGYFGVSGVALSLATMTCIGIADSIMHSGTAMANIAMGSSIIILSIMIVLLLRVQERDEDEFKKSQSATLLQQESMVTLVNNLTDAVLSTNPEGKVQVFNAAAIGLLDTNSSLMNRSIDSVLQLKNEHNDTVKILPLLKSADSVKINDTLRLANTEEEVRIEVIYAPIRSSNSLQASRSADNGYMIILRDITKSKSLEEERDEFISVVSHELRTPIAISEGALDNAQFMFNKDAGNKDLVKKSLETAHSQILYLAKMVNDLSTLSRAERGVADEAEMIDVDEMAHALYSEYTPSAEDKGLAFNLSLHGKVGSVKASRLYLQELLQNFITNSIKYTKEGTVTLEITKIKNEITFLVKDTGIGISKADQEKIFDKFYRSEDYRTRETGGTGLGLHVAKKLSRKLGTEIQVDSRLNHGSSFSFSLKAAKETADKIDAEQEIK